MDYLVALLVIIAVISIALLPTQIAIRREHSNKMAVFVCNIIGLFTGVFWLVALVWSFTDSKK